VDEFFIENTTQISLISFFSRQIITDQALKYKKMPENRCEQGPVENLSVGAAFPLLDLPLSDPQRPAIQSTLPTR
jgi:hypothetical protein